MISHITLPSHPFDALTQIEIKDFLKLLRGKTQELINSFSYNGINKNIEDRGRKGVYYGREGISKDRVPTGNTSNSRRVL
jgi:hypothetical protein